MRSKLCGTTSLSPSTKFAISSRDRDLFALKSDRTLQLVLEREFEIIGEALYRLRSAAPEIFAQIPNAHRIIGMRNILAHGYDQVDYEILWDAATLELAGLRKASHSTDDDTRLRGRCKRLACKGTLRSRDGTIVDQGKRTTPRYRDLSLPAGCQQAAERH